MRLSYRRRSVAVAFAVAAMGLPGALAQTAGTLPGSAAPGETATPAAPNAALLAEDVMVFRQLGQLRLTTGQLRECVQLLSILNRTLQDYEDHQRTAALPVAAPLRRVREALAAAQTPDDADEAKVSAALAPLKPAAAALEKQRRETIRGILHALTPAQLDIMRAAGGEGRDPADRAATGVPGRPGGAFRPADQNAVEAIQAQMQAVAQQQQAEERRTTAEMDQLRNQLQGLQQEAQKLEAEGQNPGQPQPGQNPDQPQPGQFPGQPQPGQPQPGQPQPGQPQPGQPQPGQPGDGGGPNPNGDPGRELQRQIQEAQRQAQLARRRAAITQQSAAVQVQMANGFADFAQHQAETVQKMVQLQMEMMQRAGQAGIPQEAAVADPADRPTDEDLVNRLFLRPAVLTYLRARAEK